MERTPLYSAAHGPARPERGGPPGAAAPDARGPHGLVLVPRHRRAALPAPGPGPRLVPAPGARQSERTINLDPRRGPILDRNGNALAVSVDVESIYAVPQDMEDPVHTAAALCTGAGAGRGRTAGISSPQLQRNRAFVWVKRKVDPAARPGGAGPAARRRGLPDREPPLLPAAGAGCPGARLRGPRQHRDERRRVLLRGRDPRDGREGLRADRRAAAPRGPHRAAVHRRVDRGAHPRRVDPVRGRDGAGAGDDARPRPCREWWW